MKRVRAINYFLPALLLLTPLGSRASGELSLSCLSTAKIDETAKSCEDNEAFAAAAVNCLDQLQELVNNEVEKAKGALKASQKQGLSSTHQDKSFKGAAAAYGISKASIDALLIVAHQAKEQLNHYWHDMYYPEEIAYAEAGMDFEEILLQSPCFNETQNVLIWVEDDIYQIIDELEAAKLSSSQLNKDSRKNDQQIRQVSGTKVKLRQPAKAAESAPTGKKVRASDISGTEKTEDTEDADGK